MIEIEHEENWLRRGTRTKAITRLLAQPSREGFVEEAQQADLAGEEIIKILLEGPKEHIQEGHLAVDAILEDNIL